MALKSIKVLELAGLAPSPFCGMILKDFGAQVTRIDKANSFQFAEDQLARGKRSIAVNLKCLDGIEVVKNLAIKSDVLIDPYRMGVMEKFKLGPNDLMNINPRLIYARLSGYGHDGSMAHKAGHDINYLSMSGLLSFLGREGSPPTFPINLLADFAGGGLMCALGICMALFERERYGKGQVVDSSMVEGASYLSSFLWRSQDMIIWGNKRGHNLLDGGAAFYNTYKTKDEKFMAVGALEPLFYSNFIKGLNLNEEEYPQISMIGDEAIGKIAEVFVNKTQDEWTEIFETLDACVTPVLDMKSAPLHSHNIYRRAFMYNKADERYEPSPAPKMSRTPPVPIDNEISPKIGEHSKEILIENGYSENEINELINKEVIVIKN